MLTDRRCHGLAESLQRVNDLLSEEEQLGLGLRSPQRLKQGEDAPKCLEHLIRDGGKLKQLCGWNEDLRAYEAEKQPMEVRLVVMQALSVMFQNVRHPHFWGSQAVQIPLAGLLRGCLDKDAVPPSGQEDLVHMLGSVCDKLRSCEAELLPFFFNEAAPDGEEPFLVFTIILQYMHDTRDAVHETVRRSLLACVQLEHPAVADYIATTAFTSELSAQAARQFSWVLEDGSCDGNLFRLLENCNHIAASCNSDALREALSEALAGDFVGTMQDALYSQDSDASVSATCLVRSLVVSMNKEEVREEDWRRAVDDVHGLGNVEASHKETHAAVLDPIVSALVEPGLSAEIAMRIEGDDAELALESVKLVASLLDLGDEGVCRGLVLGAVPAGTKAANEQKFLAGLDLHACLQVEQLDSAVETSEAFWARRVWQTRAGLAVVETSAAECTQAEAPTPCVQALLQLLSRFHANTMDVNFAVTAALRSVASYPHAQLEGYLFDVAGNVGGIGSVLSGLSDELTQLVSSWAEGELEQQLRSFDESSAAMSAPADMDEGNATLLRVLVLRSFVAQLAAALRVS